MNPYQIEKWIQTIDWTVCITRVWIVCFRLCLGRGIGEFKSLCQFSPSLGVSLSLFVRWIEPTDLPARQIKSSHLLHLLNAFSTHFHWNGCHCKQIDFCRFVERIKNRFYAGFTIPFTLLLFFCVCVRESNFSATAFFSPQNCCFSAFRFVWCVQWIFLYDECLFTFIWPFSFRISSLVNQTDDVFSKQKLFGQNKKFFFSLIKCHRMEIEISVNFHFRKC